MVARMTPRKPLWLLLAPVIFLLLWSGGFSVAKVGIVHAEPLSFLALRYTCVLVVLAPLVAILRPTVPQRTSDYGHLAVVGVLIQTVYFGLSYVAFKAGVSAGGVAIIVCLQPILVGLVAPRFTGEKVSLLRWLGLFVGCAIAFGLFLGWQFGTDIGVQFFAGWLTEYSLSVDNLFVFVLIMARFYVPRHLQQYVLMWGIIIALVLRGIFIALGAAIAGWSCSSTVMTSLPWFLLPHAVVPPPGRVMSVGQCGTDRNGSRTDRGHAVALPAQGCASLQSRGVCHCIPIPSSAPSMPCASRGSRRPRSWPRSPTCRCRSSRST